MTSRSKLLFETMQKTIDLDNLAYRLGIQTLAKNTRVHIRLPTNINFDFFPLHCPSSFCWLKLIKLPRAVSDQKTVMDIFDVRYEEILGYRKNSYLDRVNFPEKSRISMFNFEKSIKL